jgi:hypothetical protein
VRLLQSSLLSQPPGQSPKNRTHLHNTGGLIAVLVDIAAHVSATPAQVEAAAPAAEADGYDGFSALETRHDVFTGLADARPGPPEPSTPAAECTSPTSIVPAGRRTPASVLAYTNAGAVRVDSGDAYG